MSQNYPLSRKDNIVVQELDNETLIYDLNLNKAFCLNQTSAIVWQLCDGKKSITELSQAVGKVVKSPINEEFVWLALTQLEKENLIESATPLPAEFNGLTRRDVVRKVGFASLVALPVIMGVTAPVAAQAVSNVCGSVFLISCSCTDDPTDCAPGQLVANNSNPCPDGCVPLTGQPQCQCRPIQGPAGTFFTCGAPGERKGVCR